MKPTMELRFVERTITEYEWRDVPVEKEAT